VSLLTTDTATVTGVFTAVAALSFTARGPGGSCTATDLESTLLASTGSAVVLLAVVLIVSTPVDGATNVELHTIDAPTANGSGVGFGEHVCTAPGGNPDNAHVTATAGLGPRFVQLPLTVTESPAATVAGMMVTARRSANGTDPADCCATLLAGNGSGVVELAVPITVTPPLAGAMKLTWQTMAPPTGNGSGTGLGLHTTVAPGGSPVTVQDALAAGLGPALAHVTVPLTADPARGADGSPATVARMSALPITDATYGAVLFPGTGSAVLEPAVTVAFTVPLAGAT
jgi:hypothetical protein